LVKLQAGEQNGGSNARNESCAHAEKHGSPKIRPLDLVQVSEGDSNDEGGFHPFTQRDDERFEQELPFYTRASCN
jgi:hypothetical protein